MNVFDEIVKIVKKPENYIPRDYQTIGGMWTVDTWIYRGVRVQLMDEGYTTVILAPNIQVRNTLFNVFYEKGSLDDLTCILKTLEK